MACTHHIRASDFIVVPLAAKYISNIDRKGRRHHRAAITVASSPLRFCTRTFRWRAPLTRRRFS